MKMKSEALTLVLVNLAGIMERADEALLPGVYKEVGEALHIDPTGLGSLTLFRSLVQSLCYPIAAYLALRHNRVHVIAVGAFLWAAATFCVAISSTFFQVAVSRGLNGIGLAIVIPAIQSIVADSTDDSNRGLAFGWLQLTGNLGSTIGGLCAVLFATTSIMGIPVGILVRLFAKDPRFYESNSITRNQIQKPFWSDVKDLIHEAKSVIIIPSFQVIVAQGVFGSFSGSSWSFAPMWLELVGFSHEETAFLWTILVIGVSLGGLFGGRMGDIISSGSAIPLIALFLLVLPYDPSTAFMHGLVLFIIGFCASWEAPATNNPIFAEIVPEKSPSLAPAIVGILAQNVYGYKADWEGSSNSLGIYETNRENAASLAKALYVAIGFPSAISCFIYSFLYCTYPRDCERARVNSLIVSEMQQLEANDSPTPYAQFSVD
ncbi:hypothetical protein RGQ29_021941 [Quercus rubra]|uniref:Major facilitator superfamily (MFS) profile domain-containing protein n=1 Tax=Quercus rubra TaxID=3512 RepID=A0AAN7IRS1_QUERU|nr:hypothetical protein RGQ29_021941 [Quercus rubra]